jgi:hypothetical protein
MKYTNGEILYYVCPAVFIIERVLIEFSVQEEDSLYYIESTGAYLREENLFTTIYDAKLDALDKLNLFIEKKIREIELCNPQYTPEA